MDVYQAFADRYANDPHAAEARKLAKPEDIELAKAVSLGWVRSDVSGAGLQSVSLTLKRTTSRPLHVLIPAGTFFVSNGSAQNMVAREGSSADLATEKTAEVSIDASCANFYLDQPDSENRFSVRASHPDPKLRKLLAVIARESPPSIVAQLAIWSLTDNPSQDEVDGHLNRAPDADDYHQAAALLREAGIRPSSRAMFGG